MSINSSSKANREERERVIKLKHKYENRITIAKYGKESLDAGDYSNALRMFTDYLLIIAEVKHVKDIYEIRLNHFDPKKEITEMLMISHIYFEMARLYDAVPKFQNDVEKSLSQFVQFSANQPYQVVNSEMVRKYLKKSAFKNPDLFRNAYQQIYVQSKKCYIVTFCYGETHTVTEEYRQFKDWLLATSSGQQLVRQYYLISSRLVQKYQNDSFFKALSYITIKPLLFIFSKILLPVIIKKC